MNEPGFLGTAAPLSRDLTLFAYILLLVPSMLVGFVFARRKMFVPHHKLTMTIIMLLNWVLIGLVMFVSYRDGVAPNVPDGLNDIFYLLPTIHLTTGAVAQLLATYLVLRMWFEKVLPSWVMVKNIKLYMRTTLALWLLTAVLGAGIYYVWYVQPVNASGDGDTVPEATEAPAATEAAQPAETEATEAATAEEPQATEADGEDSEPSATPEEPQATEADGEDSEPSATPEEPQATEEAGS